MHRNTRSKTITAKVTAHVTTSEQEQILLRARAAGLTTSEWCRQALLQNLDVSAKRA